MTDRLLEHHFPDAIAEVRGFAVFMIDTEGIIQTWNKGCELLKGYAAEEAIGQNFDILFPQYLRAENLPEKERNLAKETGRYESENWRRKKSGELFWAFVVLTRVLDEDGKHIGFIKITQDQTEKKHYLEQLNQTIEAARTVNEELDRTNNDLLTSNKRLGEFAYASSHDLQAPLRHIQIFTLQLKEQLWEHINSHQQQLLTRIIKSTGRMVALTENLLTFSYISTGTGAIVDIDLNELVNEVLEDLELDIREKKAHVTMEPLPVIKGDKRQFQQLFQNLISNAIKYAKPNLPPEIAIAYRKVTGAAAKKDLPADAADKLFYLIHLKDNGTGFEQEFAASIFELFTRLPVHAASAGSGVGLSIVRKVVENHHGFVWAESKPGEGTVFKILLPA